MRMGARVVLVAPVVLVACSGPGAEDGVAHDSASPTPAPTSSAPGATPFSASPTSATSSGEPPSVEPVDDGTRIIVADSAYGPMLYDARGQAIYLFDRETGRSPRCYRACAAAWPPVLADGADGADGAGGAVRAGSQVRSGLLGTVARRGGAQQVTYAGHPLYSYAHEGPGQLLCHDVVEYGGRWLAVTPRGVAAPT